ncbi:flagellar biosynthetic protein FliR [Nitratireductor pacificus]|uniref:Flagellar biosynthetic protein FliR n=1 Tax=Nitratireductor pacificus pht-3B TaxID=391937 RepID=K2LHC8_9HYPH|nr:flagellar biosynthetic protein FliR [Nitratireductor pacificus]EKF17129.1 flagellar biosynthesis protein FliR [Nitratireductor pacificus pht-3B]
MLEIPLLAAFLAFCRIGGCFLTMPGLASARVPMQVRLFVAVAATLALLPHMWDSIAPHASAEPGVLLVLIASELAIGALIGLVARFYVLALQFIGSAMAMMTGFGMAGGGTAIEDNDPQPPMAAIISFGALMLLFILDFHHEIIRALVISYRLAPIESLFDPQSALTDITDTLSDAFYVMIRLGSPFIAYAILVNLAIGFINKLTPQIPVYFISLPFVIAGGLILLYFAIGSLLGLFAQGFFPIMTGL